MSLRAIKDKIKNTNLYFKFGMVNKINSSMIEGVGLDVGVGDTVRIVSKKNLNFFRLGTVIEVDEKSFSVIPFSFIEGFKVGDFIYLDENGLKIPVGDNLLGRVVDPFMKALDSKGEIRAYSNISILKPPISAMKRGIINKRFDLGIKAIDTLLTCGVGQKIGIFAGSGVGKSTLTGMIVKGSKTKIKVIALIGERGREVPEFIEKNLNNNLENTVLIVATSDDSPLVRKYGAFAAMSVAEYFKNQGEDVLFIMDSVTRFAMAQREIGLALGEPPTSKGYPPSALSLLPQLMERAGKEEGKGSITAFFTVLVEGDDMNDPIADQSRSILDGHLVLNRELTDLGIYPPIDILSSASRVMNDVIDKEHLDLSMKFKKMYSILKENELLIKIGAYQKGSDKELDFAVSKKDLINGFLQQDPNEIKDFKVSMEILKSLF